jgi:hypothetical protein
MYGRIFTSVYEGSMVGAGLAVFGVWNYVIAKTRMGYVELNPKHLSLLLTGGLEKEKELGEAIEFLCRKDAKSRNKAEGGARLVKEGEYQYRVVSYMEYDKIRSKEDLREYNRRKQEESRTRKKMTRMATESMKGGSGPGATERQWCKEQEENENKPSGVS